MKMNGRILVVEDESLVALDLRQALEEFGLEVVGMAASADEALALAEATQPDLALMDVNIQGTRDGIQTARMLRDQFGVPAVFLTSYSDDATIEKATKESPYGYLLKPFNLRELKAALQIALHNAPADTDVRRSNRKLTVYRQLCDNIFDGVYLVDHQRRISYWNRGAEELTGYKSEEVLGSHCHDNLLVHVDEEGSELCHGGCPLAATIQDGKRREAEVSLRHKAGHRVPVSVRVAPIANSEGSIIGAVEVFTDVTTKKTMEMRAKALESQVYCDPVTGLSNRRHIEMAVKHAIDEAEEFGTKAGLFIVDIDHFKEVNDRFGHSTGDDVLKMIADTLSQTLRPQDCLGRWGGDEFLMLVKGVERESLEAIGERCRRLIESLAVPSSGGQIHITVSIGGALIEKGTSPRMAFDRADSVLYASKSTGRNRSLVTDSESCGAKYKERAGSNNAHSRR